jgi:hypothetical protein
MAKKVETFKVKGERIHGVVVAYIHPNVGAAGWTVWYCGKTTTPARPVARGRTIALAAQNFSQWLQENPKK